jgi:hypothetical protein
MDTATFKTVWFRSEPLAKRSMKSMEDRGTLTVEPGVVTFRGHKIGTLVLRNITGVTVGTAGRDAMNNWVTVRYGFGQTAMFADGGMIGWRGILGGNNKLADTIRDAAGMRPQSG